MLPYCDSPVLTNRITRLTICHTGHFKLHAFSGGKVTLEVSDTGSKCVKGGGKVLKN